MGRGAAVQTALFSLHWVDGKDSNGIIGDTTRKTIENIGALSHDGMANADMAILKITQDKQLSVRPESGPDAR